MIEPRKPEKVSILMVDDQPARLMSYEAILRELGHHLVTASSGLEALEKLMKEDFAVILLDVSMPGMDGFETASLVHQHPRFEKTPIIFVTGLHVTDLDRLKGYQVGAVDYVYVPVVPEILRGKVSVLAELYLKRKELQEANERLAHANQELAAANSTLQAEKTRELQRANSELATTNATLQAEIAQRQRLEDALVEADRRKDEFLAMLAHELRNPLAPILNAVQLMGLRPLEDPELVWCREVIERQGEHLTRLVEDLLDVSRITQGKIKLQREVVALDDVLARAIETSRPILEARHHELAVDQPARPVAVSGDLTRLAQVVGNLLNNAAKYTEDGGSIRVSVDTTRTGGGGEEAVIRVRDNGVGIPPEMLPRVFDLFTQIERTLDRAQGGLGIGLALVRRLVELHGGTVSAYSDGPQRGSEFVVRLPTVAADRAVAVRATSPRVRHPEAGRRILVVDDNVDSAESLALLLQSLGNTVATAHDGLSGVQEAERLRPDIVILDLAMPRLDGYGAAARIRDSAWGAGVYLIALTGWGQEEVRGRTHKARFDAHLVKPVDLSALTALLGKVPAGGPAVPPDRRRQIVRSTPPPTAGTPHPALAKVAHDLRSPLNALWGSSALLRDTRLAPDQIRYAEVIQRSAEAIRKLADDLAGVGERPVSAPAADPPPVTSPLRVLVVDDDPLGRTTVVRLLDTLGHRAEEAADGDAAIAAARASTFDVVLMDLSMRGTGGVEAARAILGDDVARPPRILGLTGTALASDVSACRRAGMEAVLEKPVSADALRGALAPPSELDDEVVAGLREQRSDDGTSLLDDFVAVYGVEAPREIAAMREALDRGDATELGASAHRLKGSSLAVGARLVAALTRDLELFARASDLEGAEPVVLELELSWPATRAALRRACG